MLICYSMLLLSDNYWWLYFTNLFPQHQRMLQLYKYARWSLCCDVGKLLIPLFRQLHAKFVMQCILICISMHWTTNLENHFLSVYNVYYTCMYTDKDMIFQGWIWNILSESIFTRYHLGLVLTNMSSSPFSKLISTYRRL